MLELGREFTRARIILETLRDLLQKKFGFGDSLALLVSPSVYLALIKALHVSLCSSILLTICACTFYRMRANV